MSRKATLRGLHIAGPATKRRLLASLALSAGLLHAGGASALGLGEVVEQSSIGQALRIKIQLVGAGKELDPTCLRLAPAASHELPWVRDARLAIERRLTDTFLVVSHTQPAYHPILMLGIAAGCDGGIRREYTLLLPPNQTFAVDRGDAGSAQASSPGTAIAPAAALSLNQLAEQAFPSDRGARRRFVTAARKRAPTLFPDEASLDVPLPADARLDTDELARLARSRPEPRKQPASQAAAAARARPSAKAVPKPAAKAATKPAPAPVVAKPPTKPQPTIVPTAVRGTSGMSVADRLVLFGGDPQTRLKLSFSLSDPGRTDTTTEAERQRLREEQRLVMALDEKIMTQMEIVARIRELEALQAQLAAESRRLDQLATQAGIENTSRVEEVTATAEPPKTSVPVVETSPPPPPEPTAPAETADSAWPEWLLPAAAAAAAGALALLVMMRRRREEADDALEQAFEPHDALEPIPASADRATVTELAPAFTGQSEQSTDVDFPLDDAAADTTSPEQDLDLDELNDEAPSVDFAPLDWTPPADDLSASAAATVVGEEELGEEHESAVELAEIMMSFGRIQGAAQTLADFIRHNPRQGVAPWIKLLDVYKAGDMRGEFDALSRQLNATFNVKVVSWDEFSMARLAEDTLESMPHIVERLRELWATRAAQVYLHTLLRDNRDGTRQGFPIAVVDEILCLLSVLNELVGQFRQLPGDFVGDTEHEAADAGGAAAATTEADTRSLDMPPLEMDPK